jgi:hypothetical protein
MAEQTRRGRSVVWEHDYAPYACPIHWIKTCSCSGRKEQHLRGAEWKDWTWSSDVHHYFVKCMKCGKETRTEEAGILDIDDRPPKVIDIDALYAHAATLHQGADTSRTSGP